MGSDTGQKQSGSMPNASEDVVRPTPLNARLQAKLLYWRGWRNQEIAAELNVSPNTIGTWKSRDDWDAVPLYQRAHAETQIRYSSLIAKENKTGKDFKEIDLLERQLSKMEITQAKVAKYSGPGGHNGHLNDKVAKGAAAGVKGRLKKQNLIDAEGLAKLKADMLESLFPHQECWLASTAMRTRFIVKSRQIGATWAVAKERLIRALESGNNQIFISASKAQAHIFRIYIVQWVEKVLGHKLTGTNIVIKRGPVDPDDPDGEQQDPVTLYFLGTNFRTAQGYSGDVIIDEAFWIGGFGELFKVASAMAAQKRYTRTLISTPSIISHEAYPIWTGAHYNAKRKKSDQVTVDISHGALKHGRECADGIWRQIVTLQDAVDSGFDLIDIDQITQDYAPDEVDNLFGCQFLDDSQSSFPFTLLRRCMVDSWEVWKDYDFYLPRPFAEGEVWLGYDPNSQGRDDAAIVAVAPPDAPGGTFRVLEKKRLNGLDYQAQADVIEQWCARFNVTRIGMDTTGVGNAVAELVAKFFPTVECHNYNVALKAMMVMKAKNVMAKDRLEFDAGDNEIVQSFVSIHPKATASGKNVTYVADRGDGSVGHADVAWAIMHVLIFEPMDAATVDGGTSSMEFLN